MDDAASRRFGGRPSWSRSLSLAVLTMVACSKGGARDGANYGDGGLHDLRPPRDLSLPDDEQDLASPVDLAGVDLAGADLAMSVDLSVPRDLSMPIDLAVPPDLSRPPDMSTRPPCMRGSGWAAFRFHYSGSTSASIDALGLPDRSNFEAVPARSTSFTDALHGGGIEIASGNWLLIRFSLVGLTTIRSATFSVYGRSYNTTASGSFEAWSPIHGSISSPTNSISNAWPYTWTSVDYRANVDVSDSPGLTGIRLYAGPSSSDLVINTVELCLDAS